MARTRVTEGYRVHDSELGYPMNMIAGVLGERTDCCVWDFYIPDVMKKVESWGSKGEVLRLYYKEGLRLAEIGRRLNKTRERARQMYNCAVYELRGALLSGELKIVKREAYLELLGLLGKYTEKSGADMSFPEAVRGSLGLARSLEELGLHERIRKSLTKKGLLTVADIIEYDRAGNDIGLLSGMGEAGKRELRKKILECTGYTLHF